MEGSRQTLDERGNQPGAEEPRQATHQESSNELEQKKLWTQTPRMVSPLSVGRRRLVTRRAE